MISHSYFVDSDFTFRTDYLCGSCKDSFQTKEEALEHEKNCTLTDRAKTRSFRIPGRIHSHLETIPGSPIPPLFSLECDQKQEPVKKGPVKKLEELKLGWGNYNQQEGAMSLEEFASNLYNAYMAEGIEPGMKACREVAWNVMSFFGFSATCLSNHMSSEDLAIMYEMEDLGLVSSVITSESLGPSGKEWRITEFKLLRHPRLKQVERHEVSVYDTLPDTAWNKQISEVE